jgi:ArsR family transcriptional regulator
MIGIELKKKAGLLKAMAHPVRLNILEILLKRPCCAHAANKAVSISQPNLSQHLRALRRAGLVEFEKRGARRCYFVSRKGEISRLLKTLKALSDT